jgi:hydroxymethylglutaryl-CoA reductase
MKSSRYSGFRNLTPEQRLQEVAEFSGLTQEDMNVISRAGALTVDKADHVIENGVGT